MASGANGLTRIIVDSSLSFISITSTSAIQTSGSARGLTVASTNEGTGSSAHPLPDERHTLYGDLLQNHSTQLLGHAIAPPMVLDARSSNRRGVFPQRWWENAEAQRNWEHRREGLSRNAGNAHATYNHERTPTSEQRCPMQSAKIPGGQRRPPSHAQPLTGMGGRASLTAENPWKRERSGTHSSAAISTAFILRLSDPSSPQRSPYKLTCQSPPSHARGPRGLRWTAGRPTGARRSPRRAGRDGPCRNHQGDSGPPVGCRVG